MHKIYHNPRCSKSRQGLKMMEDSGLEFETIFYLKDTLDAKELGKLIELLNIKPIDLVRKSEAIWKSDFAKKELSDAEVIKAMVDHPKLIERPIVANENGAVIGRPPESIQDLLK